MVLRYSSDAILCSFEPDITPMNEATREIGAQIFCSIEGISVVHISSLPTSSNLKKVL